MSNPLKLEVVPDLAARRTALSETHAADRQFLFGARHFTLYLPNDPATHGMVLLCRSRPPFQDLPTYELALPAGDPQSLYVSGTLESALGPLSFSMSSDHDPTHGQVILISILNTQKPQHWTKVVVGKHEGEWVLQQQPLEWVLAHGGHLTSLRRADAAASFSSTSTDCPWKLTFTGYRAETPTSPSGPGLYLQVDTWMTYLPPDETIMAYYELAVAKRADGTPVIVDVRIDTERHEGQVFWRVRLQERGTNHVDHWVWPFNTGTLRRKLPVSVQS